MNAAYLAQTGPPDVIQFGELTEPKPGDRVWGCNRGLAGERTLSTYRDIAARKLGRSCPTGIALPDKTRLQNVVPDRLNEFERIQLMLRASGRLRQVHGD